MIVLGNGAARNKTEKWLSDLIQKQFFHPLEITYLLADDTVSSIYAHSVEAKKEFPKLDQNTISASTFFQDVLILSLIEIIFSFPGKKGAGSSSGACKD